MKSLKFSEPLPKLILEGKKTITWRIHDDKNIRARDKISLCNTNKKEFAKAEVLSAKEKKFRELTEEDKKGHEVFSSDKEMYKTYSRYYNIKVNPKTKVKIIKFKLIK